MERKPINPWTRDSAKSYSQGILTSGEQRILWISGQVSISAEGETLHEGDLLGQLNQALDNIETILAEGSMTLANIVRLNIFVLDIDAMREVYGQYSKRLNDLGCFPTWSVFEVNKLFLPDYLVELEATAVA